MFVVGGRVLLFPRLKSMTKCMKISVLLLKMPNVSCNDLKEHFDLPPAAISKGVKILVGDCLRSAAGLHEGGHRGLIWQVKVRDDPLGCDLDLHEHRDGDGQDDEWHAERLEDLHGREDDRRGERATDEPGSSETVSHRPKLLG